MPRFVLLYHDCPPGFGKPSHWDLMLERDGALLTWSLAELPAAWGIEPKAANPQAADGDVVATRLADHRLDYLTYEGPVSGERGHVKRNDGGEYCITDEVDGQLRLELSGELTCGSAILTRIAGDQWRLEL